VKLRACFVVLSFLAAVVGTTLAQTAGSNMASSQVPRLIKFSGVAKDKSGKPMSGPVGITFSLYKDQQGGSPLWVETQNVQPDTTGHYTAMLGSASAEGVPLEVFSSGEAQWLGVQIQGQSAQARVLLVSVPYALKAHEAETLSGRSISEFVLLNKTAPVSTNAGNAAAATNGASRSSSPSAANGPTSFVGTNATQIVVVTQKGTGVGLSASATTHAAVAGAITGKSNTAVYGLASNTSKGSNAAGVTGVADTETGPGVQGVTSSATGLGIQGVVTSSAGGIAVQGLNNATTGVSYGVSGQSASTGNGSAGVVGDENATTGQVYGVVGSTNSTTTNSIGVSGYEGATTGQVYGVNGNTNSTGPFAAAVNGYEGATTGQVYGVSGATNSTTNFAAGVSGSEGASTGQVYGVVGVSNSKTNGAAAVNGYEPATTGEVFGVTGSTPSTSGIGVGGTASATTGNTIGVSGFSASPTGNGVYGTNSATTGVAHGVVGQASSTQGVGVLGFDTATSGYTNGVEGQVSSPSGAAGVFENLSGSGLILQGTSGSKFTTVFTVDATGNGYFAGNLNVTGKLTKGSGSFKIDHPLDPANKYLSHSFVESPDMMNVYNGNITTDGHGLATVNLPDYFEALNGDFRYQLTVIGQFAQAIVARKIASNRFVIRTSKPNVEVSWQVTGIRHDAYANQYRIPVEENKAAGEQGYYLHPDVYGQPESKSTSAAARKGAPSSKDVVADASRN
jgi:hypothetical protein